MSVGKFLCKIGLHKGEPIIANDGSDDVENQQTLGVVQRRKVKCARCWLVYTEVINYYADGIV